MKILKIMFVVSTFAGLYGSVLGMKEKESRFALPSSLKGLSFDQMREKIKKESLRIAPDQWMYWDGQEKTPDGLYVIAQATQSKYKFNVDPLYVNATMWKDYERIAEGYKNSMRLKWALGLASVIGLTGLGTYYAWKNPQKITDLQQTAVSWLQIAAEHPIMKSDIVQGLLNKLNSLSPLLHIGSDVKK